MKIPDRSGSIIFQGIFNKLTRKKSGGKEIVEDALNDSVFFLRMDELSGYGLSKIMDILDEVMIKLCEEKAALLVFANFQNIFFTKNNEKKKNILYDLIKKEAKLRNKYFLLKPSKDDKAFLFFDNQGKKRQLNGLRNSIITLKNTKNGNTRMFVGCADVLKSPQDVMLVKSGGINTLMLFNESVKKEDFLFCSGRSLQFDLNIFSFSTGMVELFEPEVFGGNPKYMKSDFDSKKISEIIKLYLETDRIEYGMSAEFVKYWIELVNSLDLKREGNYIEKSNRFN